MRAREGALCVTAQDHRDLQRLHRKEIVEGPGPSDNVVRMRAQLQLQWLAGELQETAIVAHMQLGILPALSVGDTTTVPPVALHARL